MRSSYRIIVLMFVCVVFGFAFASVMTGPTAVAQAETPVSGPRFQISAFSSLQGNSVFHGAYVVDTVSGRVWQVRAGGAPQTVAEKLP